MANWANSPPAGSNTRRRWNLEDRASLNKLKTHIAEEGCPEVQFDLARQLLNSTSNGNPDDNSNAHQQAIHWLVCAAQQGHDDAAKLLFKCQLDRIGITPENEHEVRCCLSMTPGERAARKAARELFACLSNGGEHITPKQLERRMRKIYNLQRKRRRCDGSAAGTTSDKDDDTDSEYEHERLVDAVALGHANPGLRRRSHDLQRRVITEENLVSAASNYAAGRMPTVSDALTLSVPHPHSLDHVPCFHRMIFHPVIFFTLLYHKLINCACTLPPTLPMGLRVCGLLFMVYLFSSSEPNAPILPVFSFYFSLVVMLLSTCKILKTKQEFIDFRIWSGLFLRYGDQNIEADLSENRFLRNNLKPYLYFFCAFICNLVVYPLVSNEWLPHSELTILSGAFVFISMVAFMYGSTHFFPDWVVIISFAVNVLAKYPYEMDEVVSNRWRFLDLRVPTFPSFVIGNGIEFCLNCRTALYLMIPLLLVCLAKRARWHGVYNYLMPHCVTLSWLQVCIATSQSATMFGVMRATLGLAGIILFLPLFGIVSLLIPVFVTIDWLGFTNVNLRWSSTAVAFALAALLSCCMAMHRVTQKYVTILQLLIGLAATSVLVFPYMTSRFKDSPRFNVIASLGISNHTEEAMPNLEHAANPNADELSWDRFYTLCVHPMNEQSNKVATQIRCSHLNGMRVSWNGVVTQVQIVQLSNLGEELISKYLPSWMSSVIRCVCGDSVTEQLACDPKEDNLCTDWLRMVESIQQQTGRCSLHRWNRYSYEIRVKTVPTELFSKPTDVVLQASHEFGNVTHRLTSGDRVYFSGNLLKNHVPGAIKSPQILLKSIQCLECKDEHITAMSIERNRKSPVNARMQDLMRGIKYLLNALLNPLIIFK